jgi:hypothetical protein
VSPAFHHGESGDPARGACACPGDRVADGLVREVVAYHNQTKVAELFA